MEKKRELNRNRNMKKSKIEWKQKRNKQNNVRLEFNAIYEG